VRESDLSKPVSDWLISRGFVPYAEVPFPHDGPRTIDIVGRKDSDLITVELKRSLSRGVIHQTAVCDLITNQRYAAVGTRPSQKGIDRCRQLGIGLLSIRDSAVSVIVQPRSREEVEGQEWMRANYADRVHRSLDRMRPHGTGGVPCLKGVGPAQECYNRVQQYLNARPNARWREIFENVHNHYASHVSMCSAMKAVADGRAC